MVEMVQTYYYVSSSIAKWILISVSVFNDPKPKWSKSNLEFFDLIALHRWNITQLKLKPNRNWTRKLLNT